MEIAIRSAMNRAEGKGGSRGERIKKNKSLSKDTEDIFSRTLGQKETPADHFNHPPRRRVSFFYGKLFIEMRYEFYPLHIFTIPWGGVRPTTLPTSLLNQGAL